MRGFANHYVPALSMPQGHLFGLVVGYYLYYTLTPLSTLTKGYLFLKYKKVLVCQSYYCTCIIYENCTQCFIRFVKCEKGMQSKIYQELS